MLNSCHVRHNGEYGSQEEHKNALPVDTGALVVAAQQEEVAGIFDLVGENEADGFQGAFPSAMGERRESGVSVVDAGSMGRGPGTTSLRERERERERRREREERERERERISCGPRTRVCRDTWLWSGSNPPRHFRGLNGSEILGGEGWRWVGPIVPGPQE